MAKSFNKKRSNYIKMLRNISKKSDFSELETVRTAGFEQYIANGSEVFKLKVLNDILYFKVKSDFNFFLFTENNENTYKSIENQINNIKDYIIFRNLVSDYRFRRLTLKYLNKTMNDIEEEKKQEPSFIQSKNLYEQYILELKQIPLEPLVLKNFLYDQTHTEKFKKFFNKSLNEHNFFNIVKPSKLILDNYKILQEELKKQQQEEKEKRLKLEVELFNANKLKYITKIKDVCDNYESIIEFINDVKNKTTFRNKVGIVLNEFNLFTVLEKSASFQAAHFKRNMDEFEKQREIEAEKKRKEQLEDLERKRKVKEIEEQKKIEQLKKVVLDFKVSKNISYQDILGLVKNPLIGRVLNKEEVTDDYLFKYFKVNLKKEKQYYIENDLKEIQLLKKYGQYHLIHNMYVGDILNISPTELKRWKADKRLIVEERQEFEKWGKTLYSDYFSPKFLLSITEDMVQSWRLSDKISKKNNKSTSNQQLLNNSDQLINSIKQANELGFYFNMKNWYSLEKLIVEDYTIVNLVKLNFSEDMNKLSFLQLKNRLNSAKKQINFLKEQNKIDLKIKSYQLDNTVRLKLLADLSKHTSLLKHKDFTTNTVVNFVEDQLKYILDIRKKSQLILDLKINQYEQGFVFARKLDRHIKIVVGPTNSGKTYEALQHLKFAKSGLYLAPLRLLAMEIYDKLTEEGVPCNLITGEEKIIHPNARHTSSTIEMMNINEVVDVAIIDEFQMLADKQRGWAWTSAMVGVPANTVYIVGNSQHLPLVKQLYTHLNESYEVIEKNRFNELTMINEFVELKRLQKGDAVVAFSRKDVLSYATLIKKLGFKTSVIYGALSPEIRRKQSELFKSGKNDILVATDAIGMGLNLPIKRILFATTQKYDGEIVRTLNVSEFLQIAGRAGRYGINDDGKVGLLKNSVNEEINMLKYLFNSPLESSCNTLKVVPSDYHIETIAKSLKTKNLHGILNYFSNLQFSSPFRTYNLEQQRLLYAKIKTDIKDFSLAVQYKLLNAPVELHNEDTIEYYQYLIEEIRENNSISFYIDQLYSLEFAEQMNKQLTLFCWLSFHFDNFICENIDFCRKELTDYIQKALLKENTVNFSVMIEPRDNYY